MLTKIQIGFARSQELAGPCPWRHEIVTWFHRAKMGLCSHNPNMSSDLNASSGNRHSHATLGIMGKHGKEVLNHNNVDFTATRGQQVKATTV